MRAGRGSGIGICITISSNAFFFGRFPYAARRANHNVHPSRKELRPTNSHEWPRIRSTDQAHSLKLGERPEIDHHTDPRVGAIQANLRRGCPGFVKIRVHSWEEAHQRLRLVRSMDCHSVRSSTVDLCCLRGLLWPIRKWSPQAAQESQNLAEPRRDPGIAKEENRGLHRQRLSQTTAISFSTALNSRSAVTRSAWRCFASAAAKASARASRPAAL